MQIARITGLLDGEEDSRRWLMIATGQTGRLVELITLIYDDGYELVIHVMKTPTPHFTQFLIPEEGSELIRRK